MALVREPSWWLLWVRVRILPALVWVVRQSGLCPAAGGGACAAVAVQDTPPVARSGLAACCAGLARWHAAQRLLVGVQCCPCGVAGLPLLRLVLSGV